MVSTEDNNLNELSMAARGMPSNEKTIARDVHIRTEEPKGPRQMHTASWICIVASLLSSILLVALDNTVVADVQPRIIEAFGHIEKLPWISVAFALGATTTNLVWSKLYGQFDSKTLFIASVVLFETGSVVCGAAPSIDALIGGRALCGIGGVGMYVGAMNIVSALTTEAERPLYLSFVGLTWGIGTVIGPIIGGAFTNDIHATWRWAFYINLCIGGAAAPAFVLLIPSDDPRQDESIMSRVRDIDVAGALLNIGAFASLVMAVSFGGGLYAWSSGQIIGLWVATALLWTAFIGQQATSLLTTPGERLFPVEFVKMWELDILFAQMVAAQVSATVPIYFIPLYFQFVRSDSALVAGVRLLPYICILVLGILLNGAIMSKQGLYMPWFLAGGLLVIIGGALLFTVTPTMGVSKIYGFTIILAAGAGIFAQAAFPVTQAKVDAAKIPLAVAFITFAQMAGIALALTMSNSIFLNTATSNIQDILPDVPRDTIQQAISGALGSGFFIQLSQQSRDRVLSALVQSISKAYILVMVAGVIATALSMFMKREKLFVHGPQREQSTENDVLG